ncbi:Lipoteichoic acid synthase 2 [compost metagenome]
MFGPTQRLFKVFLLVALVVGFYALARLEFLIWNWNLFHGKAAGDMALAFLVGLRFDLSAAVSLIAPLLLWAFVPWSQKLEKFWLWTSWIVFVVLGVPFLILNLVDTEFINFVGRRFTYDGLFIVGEVQGKMSGFLGTYWALFLINSLMVVAFSWAGFKVLQKNYFTLSWKPAGWKQYTAHGFLCFVFVVLAVLAIRGGLQSKPIKPVNASVFAAPLLNNLSLNSSFTFIKSYGAKDLRHEKFFSDEKEMLSYLNGHLKGSLIEGHRPKNPQNVVIIILESFGLEYLGPHDGVTYTPFLDELSAKSLTFQNAYANGRRSIEGVAAVMGGIPALMSEPFISSHFTSNYFLGLGTLLSAQKYGTSFFHGGRNGTMYFDSFMQSAGVDEYLGSNEYANPADDDGIWGIWDEPFLQWMITKLDKEKKPFMTSVFTLSSHHPFKVPAQYEGKFPQGPEPILQTVAYTDYSLRRFFEEASKKPWFKDTLFVITADHTSKHYRPEFDNEVGNYRIPMIVYHPTVRLPVMDNQMVVQQIDILPTVLDFLGLPPKDRNFLGSSMFVPGDKVAVNYIDGRYLLTAKDYQIRWAPGQGEPQMFAMDDLNAKNELTEPAARRTELINKLKANIQYFNDGMWDNKLYYPN